VRALLPAAPNLEVQTEAIRLAEAPLGSTTVLVPRLEDVDWLNINRPLFASRALRVVLFCTREVSVALSRGAVDFLDWVSLRLDCPSGAPPFAVAGLRCALATRAPGVIWAGGDLEASFAAARPRRRLQRISAAQPYEALVGAARAHPHDWLAWTDVDGGYRLRRVRWALAEAKRRTQTLLVEPAMRSPGWPKVHGRMEKLETACQQLVNAGARSPGRLAALLNLEPEAIAFLVSLLSRGMSEQSLQAAVIQSRDPGAALGQLATEQGLLSEEDIVRGQTPPPAVRVLSATRKMRRQVELQLAFIESQVALGAQINAEDTGWWAAWSGRPLNPHQLLNFAQQGEVAETYLRHAAGTNEAWEVVADIAYSAGDLAVAHLWARRALDTSPENWLTLVRVLREQGRLDEAEALIRHQLSVPKQTLGTMHDLALHELGVLLYEKGQYAEAETMLRQSLASAEKTLDSHPLSHGAALHTLAMVLQRQGQYTEAEQLLRQSLEIIRDHDGPLHPNHGASLHELARTLEMQGRYAEAEELLRQSLAIAQQAQGLHHPDYSRSQIELAETLSKQGRYAEAETLLRQALTAIDVTFGKHHSIYGLALHQLASVLGYQGRYSEAEALLRSAVRIQAAALGPKHSTYGASLHQLGHLLLQQGRNTEAEELLRQALAIKEQSLGLHHPEYGTTLHELSRVLTVQGRYAEAEGLLRQALAIYEQALGHEHSRLCATLANLGFALAAQRRPQEGEPFLLRSVEIASNTWGPRHAETAQALSLLAHVQAILGKPEAAATARRAIDSLLDSLGPDHPVVKARLLSLNQILSNAGEN